MATADDAKTSEHPAIRAFKETMKKLGNRRNAEAEAARQKKAKLRSERIALQAEVDDLKDDPEVDTESAGEEIVASPA